jgi:chromate transporter
MFAAFTKIGFTSFGSGLSGYMHRDLVEGRGWLSEADFVSGLAVSQSMPGLNVVNLAIWLGFTMRGSPGAAVAFVGVVAPPTLIILLLGFAYDSWGHAPIVHRVLAGVAAAAAGLTLNLGTRAAKLAARNVVAIAVLAGTFVTIGILRWPMLYVVLVALPVAIGGAFLQPGGAKTQDAA